MPIEIEEFGDFAETRLNDHIIELHTQYTNLKPYSEKVMTDAYNAHKKILSKELEQRLQSIIEDRALEPVIKDGLLAIKRKYEDNLIWNKR